MAEEQAGTTTVAEPKFKIGASGTHATQAAGGITMDTPPPVSGSAESATPSVSEPAKPAPETTPPTEASNGLPPKAAPATTETTPPPTSAKPAGDATPPAQTEPAKPITWRESLKAEGFSEDFIKLAEVYKQEGNISRYAQAMNTDYSKMAPEDIHKLNIQKQYPEASKEDLDILYQTEVVDRYKLDADTYAPDSAEAKAGKLKMTMEAKKLRDQFAVENEQLKLPTKDINAEFQQQQEAAQQQRKQKQEAFIADPYTQTFLKDKKVVFNNLSIKDETGKVTAVIPDFIMDVDDPAEIQGILTDPAIAAKYLTDGKGNAIPGVNIPISVFAKNPTRFVQSLINYGKMLGKEEYVEDKHNPPKPAGTIASPAKESLNEAFGNRGKSGTHGG